MISSSTGDSERRRRAGTVLAGALALALAGAFALGAQEAPAPPGPAVGRLVVRVDGKPGQPELLDLIPFKQGDPYSPRLVDQAVKQIFRTGLFADVRVTKQGEAPVDLTFDLVRKVFINAVRFRGPKVSGTRLRQALTTQRPGDYLQEDRIPQAVQEIQAGLRQQGCFDAVVAFDILRKNGSSNANLLFRILDWKTFRIGGLEVEWKSEIPERALLRKMKTRVGDLYVPSRLEADLRALSQALDAAGYPRAEVRLTGESFNEESRRVDLRLEILPNERVVIVVNGAKVPLRLLSPIWEERVFDQWGLAEGEARILNYVRRQGYVFASVSSRIEKKSNELRVIHDVAPDGKFKIAGVGFRGNKAFSSLDLRTRLAVREGVPLLSLLSYDKIFAVPLELANLYKQNGYADVQVRLDLVQEPRGVRPVFDITEGPRTSIEAIRIEGASLVPAGALLRELVSKEGGAYFPPNVQRDVGQIETFYLDSGIRGTDVVARIERVPGPAVILVYAITEGTRVTIQDIFVTGNRTTRNRVIRRELRVRKGQPADYALLQQSKRGLERLGIFSDIRVDEVQTGPSQEVVVVTVREGEQNYAGVGLGFESLSPLTGSLAGWPQDFRPRGTLEYIRSNVFGLGAQAGILGQISTIERRAVLSWNQPYLLGLSLPTTFLAWAEREVRESFTLDRRGVSFSGAKALTRSRLVLGSLSLTRTSLLNVDLSNLPPNIDRRFLPYSAALASLSMSWERRDDTLNPTRGWFASVVTEIGVPVFGTESDYQKIFLKGQYFRPLISGLNLGLTGRLGLGNGLSHLPERFFAGGSNTFRGEEFELLGPLDPTTLKPYGGEAVELFNAELIWAVFPAWKEFRLASFFDLGNVYESLKTFRPFDLEGAAGLGLRYRTPLGPVRVEIAWKLWGYDPQDKKGRPLIFLTIGNIF